MTRITLKDTEGREQIGWLYVPPAVPRYCARAAVNVGEVVE